MRLIFNFLILKIYIVFNLLSPSLSYADNHNIYETLEIIKNDLKTLERAVYSGSIEIENTSLNNSDLETQINNAIENNGYVGFVFFK